MKTRIISGALVAVLAFAVCYFGGITLAAVLFVVSCIAFRELMRAMKLGTTKGHAVLEAVCYLWIALYYYLVILYSVWGYLIGVVMFGSICVLMILIMSVYVFAYPKYDSRQIAGTFFSVLYAPVMLSFVYFTRSTNYGLYLVWAIFISSWVCDTCAYFSGVTLGRHRLAPVLSPKKSIEGSVGGVLGSAIVGAIYAMLVVNAAIPGRDVTVYMAIICGLGAVISQIGDLAASAIKRNNSLDDYSNLIPGHGGIMDRFDSVIFTAPIIYLAVSVLIGV